MAWPVKQLSLQDKEAIAEELEKIRPWLCSEIAFWPKDGCADTCCVLIDRVRERLGNPGFRWSIKSGFFCTSGDYGIEEGHVWIQIADGTIIDPTAGQFVEGDPLQFFDKQDPRYQLKRPR